MAEPYRVPVGTHRTEMMVANSRFITTIGRIESAEEARQFLADIKGEMPDATHHVYAFRAGFGNSVTEGMSDDGEPTGTAGPPVLAVLRGSNIGDIILIVTRYFGGTKLGTGGLVRAYTEASRTGLETLATEEKIEKSVVGIESPYNLYKPIVRLIDQHHGVVEDETFAAEVTLVVTFPTINLPAFTDDLREISAGQVEPVLLEN